MRQALLWSASPFCDSDVIRSAMGDVETPAARRRSLSFEEPTPSPVPPPRTRAVSVSLEDKVAETIFKDHIRLKDLEYDSLWEYHKGHSHGPSWGKLHANRAFLMDLVVATRGRLLKMMPWEKQLGAFLHKFAERKFDDDQVAAIARR